MKNLKSLIVLIILSLLSENVFAQFKADENVRITETQDDDLYVAGSDIDIDAEVRGDLIAAGSSINVNNDIKEDLIISGGTLSISGNVGDDLRAAGGWVIIDGDIEDDLVVFAGNVIIEEGVTIGGNLIFYGGGLEFSGKVNGNVKATGGELDIKGEIEGDFSGYAEKLRIDGNIKGDAKLAANQLDLGSGAQFNSKVKYWSEEEVDFGAHIRDGSVTFDESLKRDESSWGDLGTGSITFWVIYLVAVAILLMVLQTLFPNQLNKLAETISNEMSISFVYGLLYLIATPIISLLLIVIVIGIPIGITGLVLYGLTLFLSTAIAAIVAANYLKNQYSYNLSTAGLVGVGVLCFIVIKALGMIPFIGWLFKLVLVAAVFGGIIVIARKQKAPVSLIAFV